MDTTNITRRMESVLDGLQSDFKSQYTREDFANKLEALRIAWASSGRSSKLRKLYDMFDACQIPYERGKDWAYYDNLVRIADIPSFSETEGRMLAALYSHYEDYPSPVDYMKRIVNRLCSPEDGWQDDTLRLRILKQFIKYGNYLTDAGFSGKTLIAKYVREKTGMKKLTEEDILANLDDGIFGGLATASKEQKKPEGKYGLIKCADDLAGGKYRGQGATRKSLYLFAMVYDMTFYTGSSDSGEIIDYRSDIETNLFRDYYSNNLMRFISSVYKNNLCEFEVDPSGQGINYKNFAEVVYLYFISKDYTPQEKIQRSTAMIKRLEERQYITMHPIAAEARGTAYYRNNVGRDLGENVYCEDIFEKSEDEFEAFIFANYNCDTYTGATKTGSLQLETEQNTAFREYESIIGDLIFMLKTNDDVKVSSDFDFAALPEKEKAAEREKWLSRCNYGLWFTDVAALKKKGYENALSRDSHLDQDKFDQFIDLLLAVNNFMGYTAVESISELNQKQEWTETSKAKTKALFVSSPDAVTRTSMIVAYYYYYNALHEDDGSDKRKSFEEVFANYQQDLDPMLDNAHYQKLSGKNIFDVLVVFSSYAYLNS